MLEAGADLRTIQVLLGHAKDTAILHSTCILSRRHLQAVASPLEAIAVSSPDKVEALQETDEAMSRPTLEVADIVRAAGDASGTSTSRTLHGAIARYSMPSFAAAPRHWAVISISALVAAIRPSLQLVPQSALSQVPGERARQVVGRAFG